LDNKLIIKKRELKELEQTFLKQNSLLEREKNTLTEKLNQIETKTKETQEANEKEITSLKTILNAMKSEHGSTKEDLVTSNETLKKRLQTFELELQEKTSTFEKEQILWDGKFKFIEQQRDTYYKNLTEGKKKDLKPYSTTSKRKVHKKKKN